MSINLVQTSFADNVEVVEKENNNDPWIIMDFLLDIKTMVKK